ncbi:MAG: DsbA family protein [Patescibacteria group bacterium]
MPRNKTPDYLKGILVILAIIIVSFFLLSLASVSRQKTQTALKNTAPAALTGQKAVIDNGLVSYVPEQKLLEPKMKAQAPILGNPNAPITIFEFSSFSCEYGAATQNVLKKIIEKYPDQVRLVWKDLPFSGVEDSYLAHQAARCAGQQNKFWAYSDLLWQNQKNFSAKNLLALAQKLNLNEKLFSDCLTDKNIEKLIEQDVQEADELLLTGTPHFYINSQELSGQASLADFENIIKIELNR